MKLGCERMEAWRVLRIMIKFAKVLFSQKFRTVRFTCFSFVNWERLKNLTSSEILKNPENPQESLKIPENHEKSSRKNPHKLLQK